MVTTIIVRGHSTLLLSSFIELALSLPKGHPCTTEFYSTFCHADARKHLYSRRKTPLFFSKRGGLQAGMIKSKKRCRRRGDKSKIQDGL